MSKNWELDNFINNDYINEVLANVQHLNKNEINAVLDKAAKGQGLSHEEVAALLINKDSEIEDRIFKIAGEIKENIYGNRIVMFAPLYISDYCVNNCLYCGYNCKNKFNRKRLTMDEIREEVKILEKMGHKRLALEAGEDPKNCDIDYIIETIKTIYDMKLDNGEIRRVNVNIASTTVDNFKKLKEVGIGTYILFQETYHKETYKKVHISGPKSNYEYHLTAFDRAMEAGIDDVGGGVLFGLADPYYEVIGLMLHNEHLEEKFGVGFHTISVPRICPAEGTDVSMYEHILSDEEFKRIVAIIRLAVPFTGMIISTRESVQMRKGLIKAGISQVSAGSTVEVGGYAAREHNNSQFKVTDDRSAASIIDWLVDEDVIPSFCTACYRSGRTGDRFMPLAKSGNIKNVCHPNAIMTLCEYMLDYGDDDFKEKVTKLISKEISKIENEKVRILVANNVERLKNGERDLFI